METFGQRLKALRTDKKLTQEQLGKELFVRKQTISSYEKNQKCPNFEILKKIAVYFDVSTDYLLGLKDEY